MKPVECDQGKVNAEKENIMVIYIMIAQMYKNSILHVTYSQPAKCCDRSGALSLRISLRTRYTHHMTICQIPLINLAWVVDMKLCDTYLISLGTKK